MKTAPLFQSARTALLASSVLLLASPAAHACEACAQWMAGRLIGGSQPSAHAAEMASLIKNSGWSGAAQMLANAKAQTATAQRPAMAAAGVPAARSAPTAPVPTSAQLTNGAAEPHPFQDIIDRDKALGIWETSYVPPGTEPDKRFTLTFEEGDIFIGNGVIYSGFTTNGTIPGPTIVVDEGDVVEITAINKGGVPHGLSIHAVYTQTSKYFGKIGAGESKSHTFRLNHPGVYMYHCAPGGHAIPMHTLLGQYGMIVVRPKTVQFRMDEVMGRGPDIEIFLVQHELYASGKDAIEGKAAYVLFNGKLFRYTESPIQARPGDFVRVYFLNVGPNLLSTFHLVGIIWDYAYWQGLPTPNNTLTGGQTITAGPSDSWVVDFRVPPDEGAYLMVTHAFGGTTRGAIGILQATRDAERTPLILADGPSHTAEELERLRESAVRVISPFQPGTDDLEDPYVLPAGRDKLRIQIIGNSYWPKVAVVPRGTTIEWINEDVFTFFEGEFSGVHDVVTSEAPVHFASPMLGHAERFSIVLDTPGDYVYYCTPHPYMEAIIRVK